MRHFFIGFAILIVVVAVAFQPSGAQDQPSGLEPENAVIGGDDLPNGAPVQLAAAAKIMPVCIQGAGARDAAMSLQLGHGMPR